MQTNVFRLMAGAMFLLLLGVGCSAPSSPAETEEQERDTPELVSLEQTESSFTAVVERGDAHVTIDVQRKGPRVEGFIRDPEIDSPFESDATIRNRHGWPFVRSYGGDVPVNAAENQSLEPPREANQEEQMADLQLAIDAALMLRNNPDIGERFRWELGEVLSMARSALDGANDILDGKIIPQPTPDLNEIKSEAIGPVTSAESSISDNQETGEDLPRLSGSRSLKSFIASSSSSYYHSASVRWTNCCWGFGQHSAVLQKTFSSAGAFLNQTSTRNHGRESTHSSMADASGCPKAWGLRSNYWPPLQPYLATDYFADGNAGGCGTSYGLTSGTHVCNDDSQADYWHVKYNGYGSWATCGDSTLRASAPSCN